MNVAIVGAGFVGTGMHTIFPNALLVDPPRGLAGYEDARGRRLGIVCVPTPMSEDGSCDVSTVERAVEQLDTDLICIKSTVAPGTTDRLRARTGKRIVFSPEYMGEGTYWTPPQFPQPRDPISHGFMILGGDRRDCADVADIFLPRLGAATRYRFMAAKEAEIVKYAENSFLALKVTFANELRRICEASGVCYHTVREGWMDDPRVGLTHTAAFADSRGFGGKCLPKDTAALAAYCRGIGMEPVLLDAVAKVNGEAQG